jgi:hypothetical protein
VSLDVLYIPGVERARAGLERIVAALRPGGLLVLNLPAYDWLYSEHDVAIHTSERYTLRGARHAIRNLGLAEELSTYRLCALLPLVVATRLPSMVRARPSEEDARSDLYRMPGDVTNRMLFGALRAENALIERGVRFPFGSSVYAIARKQAR